MIGATYSTEHYIEYNRTGNKNYFEEIIDMMILQEVAGLNESFRQAVKNLPKDKIRMAILSKLDRDRNLFLSIKGLLDSNIGKYEHIKDVILMLRKYVKVSEVEKKKYGEVMTPLELVREMLSKLPNEVWSNPNLKWLDPANGTGPYPTMVIYKLMEGLTEWEPNEEKRYKHIVENMIYVCEIQPKNMFLWLCAIDPWDTYNLNIYCGSFLTEGFDKHMKEVWGVDKFDIVMGNPPYNQSTDGGNGGRDLWDKFVIKSEIIIRTKGYLLYVHPPKWRKPESELFELYKRNNLIYLEIHSKQDGQRIFNAITRYDWYLLQIDKYSGKTTIKDELGMESDFNINDWDWLPNYNFNIFERILSKDNNIEVIYSRSMYGNDKKWMSKLRSDIHRMPCVYGMYKDGTHSEYFSSEDRGHFGIPKIIIPCAEKPYTLVDTEGKYGIMQNAFGLKLTNIDEAILISNAISSTKFEEEIIKSTKWLNFQIDYKMFKNFKKDFWKEFL